MIFNAVVVTILSYCFLGEVVSRAQIFGMLVIIVGVALVSLFPPKYDDESSTNLSPSSDGDHDVISGDDDTNAAKQTTLVVFWGVCGAVFLSIEIMSNKWLMIRRGINGDVSGMCFLLVEGILGTLGLLITTW